jgi:hypothetical protein
MPTQTDGRSRPRSLSQGGVSRTNSKDRTGNTLNTKGRHNVNGSDSLLKNNEIVDHSVIAVYSREAVLGFGNQFRSIIEEDPINQVRKKQRKEVGIETQNLLDRQKPTSIGTGFNDQVKALLENKSIPHVITIIEGRKEQEDINITMDLEGHIINIPYSLKHFHQGINTHGNKDDKQNMSFYVRSDLKNAYNFSHENIIRGNDVIPCVAVDYATEDKNRFRSLAVHIPNKFVGNHTENEKTHEAFSAYAKKTNKNGLTVTNYFGDTNFKQYRFEKSVPSMGGHSNTGRVLNPQSSGANEETNFMQSVNLGDDSPKHHRVKQPSTLNTLFINTDPTNKTGTDHPSIMTYTAHTSPIANRDAAVLPEYYYPSLTRPASGPLHYFRKHFGI